MCCKSLQVNASVKLKCFVFPPKKKLSGPTNETLFFQNLYVLQFLWKSWSEFLLKEPASALYCRKLAQEDAENQFRAQILIWVFT